MALNATELKILSHLIQTVKAGNGKTPSVLLLGYPDVLCLPQSLAQVGLALDWDTLPKRPDAGRIWEGHGRAALAHLPMLEVKGLIAAMGASAFIIDAIAWGGEDLVIDLNYPVAGQKGWVPRTFDIIIDPGTLEHCFNIAQAFENVDTLLAPGGFIYHQAAAAFANHGFWSISPTAFFDFYQNRDYELGNGYYWIGTHDEFGFVLRMQKVEPFAPTTSGTNPIIGCYCFRKPKTPSAPKVEFPVQRMYSSNSRSLPITDFFSGLAAVQ